jgi:hypothetical protein
LLPATKKATLNVDVASKKPIDHPLSGFKSLSWVQQMSSQLPKGSMFLRGPRSEYHMTAWNPSKPLSHGKSMVTINRMRRKCETNACWFLWQQYITGNCVCLLLPVQFFLCAIFHTMLYLNYNGSTKLVSNIII